MFHIGLMKSSDFFHHLYITVCWDNNGFLDQFHHLRREAKGDDRVAIPPQWPIYR